VTELDTKELREGVLYGKLKATLVELINEVVDVLGF